MSQLEKKNGVIADIEELLKSKDYARKVDINLADESGYSNIQEVDFSLSTDIIPVKDTNDITLRSGKKLLANMDNPSYLDVFQLQKKRIIHPEMDDYSIMNSYREIRTHLIRKSEGKNFVLLVVSLGHNMGATLTSVNLAAAFSYEGEKTSLIMDCNQYRPKLDKLFEQDINHGLTDYLDDPGLEIDRIIYPTGVNRMRFIPIGLRKEIGGEFLSSERMKEIVRLLKRRYADRYVFLNAPPLEISADAAILSEVADYVVVVVPSGKVTQGRIKKAIKLLPKDKVVGFIFNNKKNYV